MRLEQLRAAEKCPAQPLPKRSCKQGGNSRERGYKVLLESTIQATRQIKPDATRRKRRKSETKGPRTFYGIASCCGVLPNSTLPHGLRWLEDEAGRILWKLNSNNFTRLLLCNFGEGRRGLFIRRPLNASFLVNMEDSGHVMKSWPAAQSLTAQKIMGRGGRGELRIKMPSTSARSWPRSAGTQAVPLARLIDFCLSISLRYRFSVIGHLPNQRFHHQAQKKELFLLTRPNLGSTFCKCCQGMTKWELIEIVWSCRNNVCQWWEQIPDNGCKITQWVVRQLPPLVSANNSFLSWHPSFDRHPVWSLPACLPAACCLLPASHTANLGSHICPPQFISPFFLVASGKLRWASQEAPLCCHPQ